MVRVVHRVPSQGFVGPRGSAVGAPAVAAPPPCRGVLATCSPQPIPSKALWPLTWECPVDIVSVERRNTSHGP